MSESEFNNYLSYYGNICGVSATLETLDLHFENIIPSAGIPKVIDAEFVLPPADLYQFEWTLESSGLLGSLVSPINQRSEYIKIIPNLRCDSGRIRYHYTNEHIYDAHVIRHIADGLSIAIDKRHLSIIRDSLRLSLEIITKDITIVSERLAGIFTEKSRSRVLMRSTSYYKIMQMRLWTPRPLSIKERISEVRNILLKRDGLFVANIGAELLDKIVDAEIQSLLSGDIPYFWLDGKGALCNGIEIISNTTSKSGTFLSRFVERVQSLDVDRICNQIQ